MKNILRAIWQMARPLRQALVKRFDQHLNLHFESWLVRAERVGADQKHAIADMQLVADALVRELVRLQTQVQRLQDAVEQSCEADRLAASTVRRRVA